MRAVPSAARSKITSSTGFIASIVTLPPPIIATASPAPWHAADVVVHHVLRPHVHLELAHPPRKDRPDPRLHLADGERLALNLVQPLGVDQEAVANERTELPEVQLRHQDVLELLQ